MIFEIFSQGNSLLHRTDTRVKIVGAMALTLVIALCQSYYTGLAGLLTGLSLLLVSRLKWRQVLMRLVVVNSFIAFLWLTLPLTYPGDTIGLGPINLSRQGIELVTLITIKTNGIILIFISLLATSTVAELGHGLEGLRLPTKLCLLLLFSYRYIFVVSQEYQRLARAAKLRCFRPGTNLHTYRTYGHLFGMTLVKSWNRAERVGQGMLLRGFHGRFYSLDEQIMAKGDLIFLIIILTTVIGLGGLEFLLT
ncbi:MAG: cobalt ECF transporter T component CbiQ [Desulfobulbaceae bacterium]|jgi:cobalt/nickel transport system permease protein|nr:cobalt ECF transporter T component CbiQ [Desulfobulbaceae bacterium]